MRDLFVAMTRNPWSLVGATITTASAVLIVSLFAVELFGFLGNPYIGILVYLVFPALFVLGLLMIPFGVWRERRRVLLHGEAKPAFPVIDFNQGRMRRWFMIIVLLTAANIVILAAATYKGVEVMDSAEFCGTTCHSVMNPEHTVYQRSPHSRVSCTACHIGPGADWFVKSKLSGAWQVVSTAFELYPRPIPTPIHDLRPARETCEQCHWPEKFIGDRLSVRRGYSNDEANTPVETVLLMRIGGQRGDASHGIHWHVDPDIRIRYRSDSSRETIHEVELTRADGTVERFLSPQGAEATEDEGEGGEASEWRLMDCVDCHNRPSHIYRTPEQEVNQALTDGRLPADLPFIRREGVRVLQEQDYESQEAAREGIQLAVRRYYEQEYPELARARTAEITAAGETLGKLYSFNVFPLMNIEWGTYPNHIGHETSPGCFRCHDDEHRSASGATISQDCSTCHALLALEETDPEILETLEY